MMRLLLVVPFCRHDFRQAKNLLEWIRHLGPYPDNECLLVSDCKVQQNDLETAYKAVHSSFKRTSTIKTPRSLPNERWPIGPNWMFETCLREVSKNYGSPFFWCEPDCIPLKRGWLQLLEREYNDCGKPYMGAIVHSSGRNDIKGDHLTGCAIYPQNAHDRLHHIYGKPQAFDMAMADVVLPFAHHTNQHYHYWNGTRPNANQIGPQYSVFHRDKQGSLIRQLKARNV